MGESKKTTAPLSQVLSKTNLPPLQLNMGGRPGSLENMVVHFGTAGGKTISQELCEKCLSLAIESKFYSLTIIGEGANQHPFFPFFVERLRFVGIRVRLKSSYFQEDDETFAETAKFLAHQHVELTLPFPLELTHDERGKRVKRLNELAKKQLKILNQLGYGKKDTERILDFDYSSSTPVKSEVLAMVEKEHRYRLKKEGIYFNRLVVSHEKVISECLSNSMPHIIEKNSRHAYYFVSRQDSMRVKSAPCLSQIAIDKEGKVHHCIPHMMYFPEEPISHSFDDWNEKEWRRQPVLSCDHCYLCVSEGMG